MIAPVLLTIEETLAELRIARCAREYVLRSEEMARLMVESDQPLDPKIELATGEAWARLLEAVKATGPPGAGRATCDRAAARLNSPTSQLNLTFRAAAQPQKKGRAGEGPSALRSLRTAYE